jgi:NAD(P)-dependent dehydrogenase (short-subunit alcohol dehydrogenase family)
MDLKLGGKTALVTGSTAGIGLTIAHSLAVEGARVWINGRTPERVEGAAALIRKAFSEAQVKELSRISVRVQGRAAGNRTAGPR